MLSLPYGSETGVSVPTFLAMLMVLAVVAIVAGIVFIRRGRR